MTGTLRRLAPLWAALLTAATRAQRVSATRLHSIPPWLGQHRTAILATNGFVWLSVAAWDWLGRPAGLAAFGLSSLILEVLSD